MQTVDDAQSSIHGEDDQNRSAVKRRSIILKEVVNPPRTRSGGDSGIMLRFKFSSSPLPAEDIGFVRKVSVGDEEKTSETNEKPNHGIRKEDCSTMNVFPSPTKARAIISSLNPKRDQKTACNTPPQPAIGNPKCEKKSARLQRNCEKADRAKFFVSLSRHEIEQDFIALTGKKPPGKPRKRPRVVQNQINDVLPGQSLTEVHADQYKVKENGKQ